MNASYEVRADYIYIKVFGEYSNSSVIELFRKWLDEAKRSKLCKVVCDLTQLVNYLPKEFKTGVRLNAGELIALFMPKNISLAILTKSSRIEIDRVVENLMRNRGIRVKLTASLDEALNWLNVKHNPHEGLH
jgi:hypothetical protein